MGKNQDMNWCVTRPWFDWILGTRERYAFTREETRRRLSALRKKLAESTRLRLPKVTVPTLAPPPASNESSLGAA
jgi:hypothetical protein